MPLQPGTRLGPYEVQAPLGKGGMGEVYRARDLRLKRDVAVKVLPTHLKPGSLQLAQFEREAHLLASLNHPNICSIYDVGVEGGTSFMVMEHLQGETLAARIDRGAISANVALLYAIQIVEALGVAHAAGLVHRDIKPGNIMLTTTGVKLLDFGLAKRHMAAAAAPPVGSHVETSPHDATDREGIVGTLHYMAPEQLAGAGVDARSDIWAFGCVVYEMVTGRRAFSGKTLTDVITSIVTERPMVMTLERGVVPLALEHVVSKCLARNPSERFQSAGEVARELRSMLPHAKTDSAPTKPDSGSVMWQGRDSGSGPLSPQGAGTAEPVPAPPRSRTRLLTAGGAAVVLLAGAAWYLFVASAPAPASSVAVMPFANVEGTSGLEYLMHGLADGIAAELGRRPRVRVVAASASADNASQADPRAVGQSLGVNRIVSGRISTGGGRINVDAELVDVDKGSALWSGHYSETQANLVTLQRELVGGVLTALELEAKSQDAVLATLPPKLDSEAYRLILRGRYMARRRDESALKSAVALFSEATAKDAQAAAAHAGLATSYIALAEPAVAAQRPNDAFPRAKRAAARAIELDPSLAEGHTALGVVKMSYDRDWKGAWTEFERAVALAPEDPAVHMARSAWLMNMGRSEEALAEARQAIARAPSSVTANFNLGWQLYLARHYSEAIDQLVATVKLDSMFAAAHWVLGAAYEKSGRLDEAIRELQDARLMSQGKAWHLAELGYTYARAARTADARQMLDRLRNSAGQEVGASFGAALVAAGLNDAENVFTFLQRAVDEHTPAVATLNVDPRFDDMRSDPRFKDLLKRVGL